MNTMVINAPRPNRRGLHDLTLSGDLYEGNYNEWHARTMASLRLRRLDAFLTPGLWFTDIGRRTTKEAADHVCVAISEATLQRVPDEVKDNCSMLMKVLKKFAAPFRFLDLPVEVRNKIYKMVLPTNYRVFEWESYVDKGPAMLHINAQIRHEALPIFYHNAIFTIKVNMRPEQYYSDSGYYEALRDWSKSTLGTNARLLRTLHLWISESCKVIFRFRADKLTLKFKADQWIRGSTRHIESGLNDHVEKVEQTLDALDVKGEMIMVTLLLNWNLWWELIDCLELEEDRDSVYGDESDDGPEEWNWVP